MVWGLGFASKVALRRMRSQRDLVLSKTQGSCFGGAVGGLNFFLFIKLPLL